MGPLWTMLVVSPGLCRREYLEQSFAVNNSRGLRLSRRPVAAVTISSPVTEPVSALFATDAMCWTEVFRQFRGWHFLLARSANRRAAADLNQACLLSAHSALPVYRRSCSHVLLWARYVFELESGLLTSLEEILPPARPDTPNFDPKDGHWKTAEGAESKHNWLSTSFRCAVVKGHADLKSGSLDPRQSERDPAHYRLGSAKDFP